MKRPYFMHTLYIGSAFAAMALATAAHAASVRFDTLEALWTNPTGGSSIVMTPSYDDPATIRWGIPHMSGTGEKSGYEFDAVDTPFIRPADDVFALGRFTHFNKVINLGTGISSVELFLKADIVLIPDAGPEVSLGENIFRFLVKHDETPNVAPCLPGSVSVCDDAVSITALDTSDMVLIDGTEYTLSILGFSYTVADAEAGIFDSEFLSPENGTNTRVLAATFSVAGNNPAPVPLPAGLPMLLAGLGLMRIRKGKPG